MIKATATEPDGTKLLVIGLSFGNLERFREQPGDTYIRIRGAEHGLPVDIMIFSGETEAHMAETLKGGIDASTKIIIDDKLKS